MSYISSIVMIIRVRFAYWSEMGFSLDGLSFQCRVKVELKRRVKRGLTCL